MTNTDNGDVVVAYVGGWGRSGSTILARMLAEVGDNMCSGGEIRDIFWKGVEQNRECGCGNLFRDCEFWSHIGEVAYGGWDQLSIPHIEDLKSRTDRPWHVPALLKPGLRKDTDQAVEEYGAILAPLYRAMSDNGAKVVIDSSKFASFAAILRRTPGLSPRFIHLVRDPRGTLYSWTKSVRVDEPNQTLHMPQYGIANGAARYVAYNYEMHAVEAGAPHLVMKYEDLVADPEPQIRKILALLDVAPDTDLSHFMGPEGVKLGITHTVMGNPMRKQSGWIPLRHDVAWKTELTSSQKNTITALTLPLLKKYGYDTSIAK